MALKRVRGSILRLALKRPAAIAIGIILLAPSVWLLVEDRRWESPATDGIGLILGATGAAFLAVGIGGRRPDWIEPE
jgi:hypothetical protein